MTLQNEKTVQRVAAYVRVSHQEQKLRGLSPAAQTDALMRYAEEHNLKIVEWYIDLGVSGRKLIRKRPELQRMIKDAENGDFDRIIFIKLDRYFRSVAEYHECQKRLDAKNVTWTATEEKYDLTTASGRYWVTQKLAMAEYEADLTGERIDLVNEFKVRDGQPLTGAQSLGYAYSVEKDGDGVKKVVKDPNTKDIVMDYINYFLMHHNKRQALIYVNEKYGCNVNYMVLSKVLTDTKIYGHYRGNDRYCEPYIDKETFDKIQVIIKCNVKETAAKRIFLFTGLVKCPECGRILCGKHTNKSVSYNKKTKKRYEYVRDIYSYRCNDHYTNDGCGFSRQTNEKKIEKYLVENFDKCINAYIDDVKIEDKRERNDEHIREKIKDLNGQLKRVNRMYKLGKITDDEYDHDSEELEKQIQEMETKLEPVIERDLTIYYDLLNGDWKTLYDALNKENKRAFWRKYIKSIELNDDGNVKRVIFF